MRKLGFFMITAAVLLLAACTPANRAPAATVTPEATAPPTEIPVPTRDVSAVEMQCRVVSMIPTPEPDEVSKFPPPSAEDWTLGNNSASMTITEYSDYQ
jgi:hypothetical protein